MKENKTAMTANDDTNMCNKITRRNSVKKSSYFLKKKNGRAGLNYLYCLKVMTSHIRHPNVKIWKHHSTFYRSSIRKVYLSAYLVYHTIVL